MATMFSGNEKQVRNCLYNMTIREFLERLLVDDVVTEIVSSGTILVVEWTEAVDSSCGMIGFGIIRDTQNLKNVYFAGVNDNARGIGYGLRNISCDRRKVGISVSELMDWIRLLNVPSIICWAGFILEAKKQFVEDQKRSHLPLRFRYLYHRINSAIS